MSRRSATAVALIALAITAGCGSKAVSGHKATAPRGHPVAVRTVVDAAAIGACKSIDAAIATIPTNPMNIDVEAAGAKVQDAAATIRGVVPIGMDAMKLGDDMAGVIAKNLSAEDLNTDLLDVVANCSSVGYTFAHASIGSS